MSRALQRLSLKHVMSAMSLLVCVSVNIHHAEAQSLDQRFVDRTGRVDVGIQVKIERFTPAMATQISETGFRFVRFGVWVNAMRDAAYRKRVENAFAAARQAGLPVLLTVRSTAPLAQADVDASTRNAQLRAAAAALVSVVSRAEDIAGENLLAIELWNEPDLSKYWPTGDVDTTFPLYMREVCADLRHVQTSAAIVGFGFASAPTPGSDSDRLLLSIQLSNPGCIDAVSYHAYGMDALKIQNTSRYVKTRYRLPTLITEWGVSTAARGGEIGQAAGIANFLSKLSSLLTPLVSIYEWQDTMNANNARERGFGLLTATGAPKPAYDTALKALSTP